jgi:hypothetical protein
MDTRDLLTMKNFHVDSQQCAFCDDSSHEDYMHLFFSFDFTQQFWWKLNIEWNTELDMMEMFMHGRRRHAFPCFKEALIVGS